MWISITTFSRVAAAFGVAALTAAIAPHGAEAAGSRDMVVVFSSGPPLKAGEVIDGGKKLDLAPGVKVTLISQDGGQIELQGPYSSAPAAGIAGSGDDRGVVDALGGLFRRVEHSDASLGAVRSVDRGDAVDLPDPWVVDVDRAGDHCVRADQPVVLFRARSGASAAVSVRSVKSYWRGWTTWGDGASTLSMGSSFDFKDGDEYDITLDGRTRRVTLHLVSGEIARPAAQAAIMASKGCDTQAMAMIGELSN